MLVRLERRDRLAHPAEQPFRRVAPSSTATMPRPVSSAPSSRSPASTNADPSTGWPANGSSAAGREDADPGIAAARGGSAKTVSERFSSRARRCIVASSNGAPSVKTARPLPSSGVSVKTSAITYGWDRDVTAMPPFRPGPRVRRAGRRGSFRARCGSWPRSARRPAGGSASGSSAAAAPRRPRSRSPRARPARSRARRSGQGGRRRSRAPA